MPTFGGGGGVSRIGAQTAATFQRPILVRAKAPRIAAIRPVTVVYLIVLTAWLPLEDLFGQSRSLLAFAGGVNVSGLRLVVAVAALAVALLALRHALPALRELPRGLGVALALYGAAIAWLAITLAWSPQPGEGARAIVKLLVPALALLVLLADGLTSDRAAALRRALGVLAITLVAGTVYGTIGVFERSLLPAEPSSVSAYYGWAGWSLFGFLLAVGAVFAVSAARYRLAPAAGPLALLALVQIPLCLKRITVAAVVAALAYLSALPGPRRWLALAPALVAVSAVLLFPPLTERMWSGSQNLGQIVTHPFDQVRTEGRDQLWSSAFAETQGVEHVIGNGAGAASGVTTQENGTASPQLHSEPVRTFLDGGAVGGLLLFGSYIALAIALARLGSRAVSPRARAFAQGASAGLVVVLVTSLTDNTFDYYTVGAFVATAVAAAVIACASEESQGP
jgi:hypothetical protein